MAQQREKVVFLTINLYVRRRIKNEFETLDGISCDFTDTLRGAQTLIGASPSGYFAGIIEAPLLDEESLLAVRDFASRGLPPVVLTNEYTDCIREEMNAGGIMDYIIKDARFIENLARTVGRIRRNMASTVLVVDDSPVARERIKSVLVRQKLNVVTAGEGEEALRLLHEHAGVSVMIVDYQMPGMNGVEVIQRARKTERKNRLAIIGLSDADNPGLSARLLKNGADDFLFKAFLREELYLRVVQNLEVNERLEELKRLAEIDPLTQLYNRRFFYEVGEKLFANVARKNMIIAVAMLDVDHFKAVNDRHGHSAGDQVLRFVARVLKRSVRSGDLAARYGGEEFCVIAVNVNAETAAVIFERIRAAVAGESADTDGGPVSVTVSIGVTLAMAESLDKTIALADGLLYQAKTAGRNRVVVG